MFFGKSPRPQRPIPLWIKLGVGVIIAYAVIAGQKPPGGAPLPVQGEKGQTLPGALPDWKTFTQYSAYKDKIFPVYKAALRMRDVEQGRGMPAVCGQKVSIAYESFLPDNTPAAGNATKDDPLTFRLGRGETLPALEEGIIGMQPGGRRSLIAPPRMAYGAEGFARTDSSKDATIRFEVELLEISPALPGLDASPYRIAETYRGTGGLITCGQPAKVHLAVWSVEGKKLFDSKEGDKGPLTFTPGRSEVFLGLEQGVLGMQAGGARLLVVPPPFQRSMDGNPPAVNIPWPKTQTVLVDVEAVP